MHASPTTVLVGHLTTLPVGNACKARRTQHTARSTRAIPATVLEDNSNQGYTSRLHCSSMPYVGNKSEIEAKTETEREANRIVKMSAMDLAEIYIDQNSENLPTLKTHIDAKQAIISKLKTYNETIN